MPTLYFFLLIVFAVFLQNLGKLLCLKIFKTNLQTIRKYWHWKRFVYELSGIFFLILIAFILNALLMMSYGKVYLANKDVLYGIEVSETAEAVGFKDGDKIISINGEKVKEFVPHFFTIDILLEENAFVNIERNGELTRINISEEQKRKILENRKGFIEAKHQEELPLTHENYNIAEISTQFLKILSNAKEYALEITTGRPYIQGYKKAGGQFIFLYKNDIHSHINYFSFFMLVLFILNLIPLPGLDSGNTLIALLEMKREKRYNSKTLLKLRLLCIFLLISWIILFKFVL